MLEHNGTNCGSQRICTRNTESLSSLHTVLWKVLRFLTDLVVLTHHSRFPFLSASQLHTSPYGPQGPCCPSSFLCLLSPVFGSTVQIQIHLKEREKKLQVLLGSCLCSGSCWLGSTVFQSRERRQAAASSPAACLWPAGSSAATHTLAGPSARAWQQPSPSFLPSGNVMGDMQQL